MLCFPYLVVTYFSTLSDKCLYFQERIFENKILFLFCPHIGLETFVLLRIIQRYFIMNIHTYSLKVPIFFSHYNKAWIFPTVFGKDPEYQIFKNPSIVSPVVRCGWEDGRTDGRMYGPPLRI